ncbi:hypothetical protein B0A50_00091 [Salinomyces thailandicus]|uniref:F-box domain-containing protein n=1 Tax=Salinomyces thailandicus TaxID=706561 RepID=A0A4U0UEZ4_9PEZI|nr:hypothetical protein B0A50_00091 [Salinomyces thailandica]
MTPSSPSPVRGNTTAYNTNKILSRPSTFTSTASMRSRHSHLDEGFSEETRSQSDPSLDADLMTAFAVPELDASAQQVLAMCLDLPPEQRKLIVDTIVKSLPNRDKEAIGMLCEELTHFDPAVYLPNELMFSILSYLTPQELLSASAVSRPWRERSQDEKLWRSCFAREGWVVDPAKIREFELQAKQRGHEAAQTMDSKGKARAGDSDTGDMKRRNSRKRKTEEAFSEGEGVGASPSSHSTLHGTAGGGDSMMDGVEPVADVTGLATAAADGFDNSTRRSSSTAASDTAVSMHPSASNHLNDLSHLPTSATHSALRVAPDMWRPGSLESKEGPRVSWPWLYKNRFLLEKNWEAPNKNKMFSLPHHLHPEEGHKECVYTIQHTSRHLVSGSRDKTIRKWDLRSHRLIGKPLEGHTASVLCLQFDERPEHDIIVSGGSDALVILWQFSTGSILNILDNAHAESVLNLRFDDRYLVTCSKDKSIKVWNRRALAQNDPLVPTHCFQSHGFVDMINEHKMVREYSLMAQFHGHQAAVNAVMIHGDTVISASGDRTIKSWSISKQRVNKAYTGHAKGIACVQFDGRRIVSGSSDNTVRIFDAEQQAEVGCLQGHENLVRTVQARFGDLDTVTDEELEDEAKEADRNFFKALEAGMAPASSSRRAHDLSIGRHDGGSTRGVGIRNAGSSRPEDMLSVGTKVPPGGGGSRWAKIVSGSYDERLIVWKRGRDGGWFQKATFTQDKMLRNRTPRRQHQQLQQHAHQQGLQAQVPGQLAIGAATPAGAAAGGGNVGPLTQGPAQQNQPAGANAATQQHQQQHAQQQLQTQTNLNHSQQQPAHQPPAATAGNALVTAAAANPHPPVHGHPHHAHPPPARHHSDSNRVFKLQFDTRRLICCSQNKVIVGWDFANADEGLERVGEWCVETS